MSDDPLQGVEDCAPWYTWPFLAMVGVVLLLFVGVIVLIKGFWWIYKKQEK